MNVSKYLLLLGCLFIATGCDQNRTSLDNPILQASTPAAQMAENSTQVKDVIPTETLSPQPIRINLQNLPAPFATDSASKPPQVVPVPEKPIDISENSQSLCLARL
ncbi:hypothetical protein [Nostoc sp. UHCC 0870]|uniref:hypothetical protein n=1 Tax=Nostoc sp. UHCC 0870 TaxID=2914041 RepID=UPI002ED4B1E9